MRRLKKEELSLSERKRKLETNFLLSSTGWIDVSVPLRSGMAHWPGDPDVKIEQVLKMEKGDD